jgi:CIC family chloride channel protein
MGVIGLFFPYVMGVGYDTINAALYGKMVWELALALIFVKIIATSITLGSGGSGGIFAPSLFMGAMVGYFFGYVVHSVFPETTATPGAYALVAMGGLVAGTTRAPITAIIIVFELTNDYKIILPLMVTCIISTILSARFSRESIYTLKLVLKNIGIKEGVETNVLESIYVKDVYNDKYSSINVSENFNKIVNDVLRAKDSDFPVIDSNGKIRGMLSLNDIKDYLFEKDSLQNLLIAGDIANPNFETVTPDDNCRIAHDKLRDFQYSGLPVIEEEGSKKVIGMIWRKDIQDAYDKEIERVELTSNLASSITMKDDTTRIHFMEGYSIDEINPPKSFIGKSIRDLNIRVEFGVDVLSIKTKTKRGEKINAIPNPGYVITENDTLIVAGEIKNINMIRNIQ